MKDGAEVADSEVEIEAAMLERVPIDRDGCLQICLFYDRVVAFRKTKQMRGKCCVMLQSGSMKRREIYRSMQPCVDCREC